MLIHGIAPECPTLKDVIYTHGRPTPPPPQWVCTNLRWIPACRTVANLISACSEGFSYFSLMQTYPLPFAVEHSEVPTKMSCVILLYLWMGSKLSLYFPIYNFLLSF